MLRIQQQKQIYHYEITGDDNISYDYLMLCKPKHQCDIILKDKDNNIKFEGKQEISHNIYIIDRNKDDTIDDVAIIVCTGNDGNHICYNLETEE